MLLKEKHTFSQRKKNCSRDANFIFRKVIAQKETGTVGYAGLPA